MKKIIILATLLYLLIAPFSYHPDTKLTLYYPSLNDGRVTNIYKYLNENASEAPKFHYPPLHFFVLKGQYAISSVIGGEGFDEWLSVGGSRALEVENLYRYILASKVPIIILVLLSAVVLYWISGSTLVSVLWLFNPITLYSAIMMGQNDIFALFPFMLGLGFYFKKPYLAFMLFGLGAAVKTFPLLWIIILAMAYPKASIIKKISLVALPFLMYMVTLLPYMSEKNFLSDVMYSGLSERMFVSQISLGFGDAVMIVPLLLSVLGFMLLTKRIVIKNFIDLSYLLLAVNLVILGFSHFHPQWFLWTIAFISIMVGSGGAKKHLVVMGIVLLFWTLILLLFPDKYLSWGIVSPLNKGLLNMPFISELFDKYGVDSVLLNSLSHSVIAAASLYFMSLLKGKKSVEAVSVSFPKKYLALVLGSVLVFMLAVSLIPSIKSYSNESEGASFRKDFSESEVSSFKSRENALYRVELRVRNINQEKGNIDVSVESDEGVIVTKSFDEVNVGVEGNIRIDFATLNTSKDKDYYVVVKADENFEIKSNSEGVVVESFYKNNSLVGVKNLAESLFSAVRQAPLWPLMLVLLSVAYLVL